MNWINGLIAVALVGLSACASIESKSPLPTNGPAMIEIYRGAITGSGGQSARTDERVGLLCDDLVHTNARRECHEKARDRYLIADPENKDSEDALPSKSLPPLPEPLYDTFNRTADNELRILFPRLPNPDIAIYIYPHLATKNQVPVPGYATVIPLYDRVQYALPGEPHKILNR